MTPKYDIIVPVNRNRFPIVFLVSVLTTVLLSINLIYTKTEYKYMNGLFNRIFNSLLLVAPICYTIISFADYIKSRFDKNAMLTVTDTGLRDNLSILSCGNVLWTDVKDAVIVKYLKADFLIIKLHDNDRYLRKINFAKRYS
jgi:hypothetical protein